MCIRDSYPPPQQQPVMMAPGAVQYVSGQQPTVQFIPAAPQAPQTIQNVDRRFLPAHNIILVAVVTIGCALLNFTSLVIGVPAMMCAVMAYNAMNKEEYSTTKTLGYIAVVLSVVNILYTGIISIILVGMTIGLYCRDHTTYNNYDYDYDYYYYYRRCQ